MCSTEVGHINSSNAYDKRLITYFNVKIPAASSQKMFYFKQRSISPVIYSNGGASVIPYVNLEKYRYVTMTYDHVPKLRLY